MRLDSLIGEGGCGRGGLEARVGAPPGRVDHAIVYNWKTGTIIMFGGRKAEGAMVAVPEGIWEYRP